MGSLLICLLCDLTDPLLFPARALLWPEAGTLAAPTNPPHNCCDPVHSGPSMEGHREGNEQQGFAPYSQDLTSASHRKNFPSLSFRAMPATMAAAGYYLGAGAGEGVAKPGPSHSLWPWESPSCFLHLREDSWSCSVHIQFTLRVPVWPWAQPSDSGRKENDKHTLSLGELWTFLSSLNWPVTIYFPVFSDSCSVHSVQNWCWTHGRDGVRCADPTFPGIRTRPHPLWNTCSCLGHIFFFALDDLSQSLFT